VGEDCVGSRRISLGMTRRPAASMEVFMGHILPWRMPCRMARQLPAASYAGGTISISTASGSAPHRQGKPTQPSPRETTRIEERKA
jgi:hypothetical protein